jgi:hypothetical protein
MLRGAVGGHVGAAEGYGGLWGLREVVGCHERTYPWPLESQILQILVFRVDGSRPILVMSPKGRTIEISIVQGAILYSTKNRLKILWCSKHKRP